MHFFQVKNSNNLTQIIRARRSIRKYTAESITRNQLEAMIEAARLAPSAKNRQPWKYIVYMEKSKAELLEVMEKALIKEQKEHVLLPKSAWALSDAFHTLEIMRNAPAVIIVMNPDGKSPYGQLIGAIAVGYADEKPNPRPRKEMGEILEYRD